MVRVLKMIEIGNCKHCGGSILREEGKRGRKPVYCQSCRDNPISRDEIDRITAEERRRLGDERAQRLVEMLEMNRISDEERQLRLDEVIAARNYGGRRNVS